MHNLIKVKKREGFAGVQKLAIKYKNKGTVITMKKILSPVVQYPFDAQTDSFFCAISSALLPALGYDENTPFYCAPHGRYCTECGGCRKNAMQRHHLMLYHCLLAATGVAFGFDYPEDDTVRQHSMPGAVQGWRWSDDFVGFIMGLCGLDYLRISSSDDKSSAMLEIKRAIDAGYPVPARFGVKSQFGEDTAWSVITGYDGDKLLGLDSKSHYLSGAAEYDGDLFMLGDLGTRLSDAVIITGVKEKRYGMRQVLEKISGVLSAPAREEFKKEVNELIDASDESNAEKNAELLCAITGVPAEARWHAAEAFCSKDNFLTSLSEGETLQRGLSKVFFERYIKDNNDETHGLCWKLWSLLGGPNKSADAGARLLRPETKSHLKRMWAKIFENDEAVLAEIKELLASK